MAGQKLRSRAKFYAGLQCPAKVSLYNTHWSAITLLCGRAAGRGTTEAQRGSKLPRTIYLRDYAQTRGSAKPSRLAARQDHKDDVASRHLRTEPPSLIRIDSCVTNMTHMPHPSTHAPTHSHLHPRPHPHPRTGEHHAVCSPIRPPCLLTSTSSSTSTPSHR